MKKQVLLKLLIFSIVSVLILTAASPLFSASQKVRVFVEFAPGHKNAVEKALNGAGAEFHYTFDHLNSFVVTLPKQALKGLAKNPNVVDIEEDAPRYPVQSTPSTLLSPVADIVIPGEDTVPYGVDAVQARELWDADLDGDVDDGAIAGDGVKVCIIDTGYFGGHEDLLDLSEDSGFSLVDNNWNEDGYGHGSHVAGTIAAEDNDIGVIGVAPNVSFFIVKYFDNAGDYVRKAHASDLVEAALTCFENGANIISMSLSGTQKTGHEERTFDMLYYDEGLLSIGAASNDGIDEYHYPASYDSVISVAAVDEFNQVADFSQYNDQVELAAPGVAVLSTIPYIETNELIVSGVSYESYHIEYAAYGPASGALVDGGLCLEPGDWAGAVVLCQRGDITFYEKVMSVQDGGGAAAIIYNNEPGNFLGTLGDADSASEIVALSISQEDGEYLVASQLGAIAELSSDYYWPVSGYEAWDGTSMATPHVSAVAALLWAEVPTASNVEIRNAMDAKALDLGEPGRDDYYGFGLVQAADALEYLLTGE